MLKLTKVIHYNKADEKRKLMIILYTKNLQQFLGIPGDGVGLPQRVNEDALWHGNIFLIQRKKVLQLTHEASRFTIFIHGLTKKDLSTLDAIIVKHLRYHLLHEHVPLFEMKYIDTLSSAFSFFKKPNRSVTGTMNNMKAIYEHIYLSRPNGEDRSITHTINHMLFKIDKEYIYPVEVFKEYMLEASLAREVLE